MAGADAPRVGAVTLPGPAPRVRQQRAVTNDARILEAATAILADDGWEDTSVLHVADRAGLSRRPVLTRYGDRAGVATAAWRSGIDDELLDALRAVVAARGSDRRPTDPQSLGTALAPFLDPSVRMRAAAELLIVSSFQPDVHQAVLSTLHAPLQEWLTPQRSRLSRSDAARHAFVIALALGCLLESRSYPDGLDIDLTAGLTQIAHALDHDVAPRRLPGDRATFLRTGPSLHLDPGMHAMLDATLRLVGRDGYEAATMDRISAECGRTSGFLFGHYSHKRDLYIDASARALAQAEQASHDFMADLADRHSWGVAYAVLTREVMRPEFGPERTNTLEQYRLSWHDPGFLEAFAQARTQSVERAAQAPATDSAAEAESFLDLARGIGLGLLAQLHPEAHGLPHDVVTVPLIDG